MTEGETMSGNRFSYCLTADEVLDEYLCRMDANPATRADAVARIAELTRTVTAKQRARVEEIVSDRGTWRVVLHGEFHAVADRIIDALGYQAEPAHDNDDDQCKPSCHCQPVPPAPVVELDAVDLDVLARNIKAWSELAIILNVDDTCELPIGCGRIAYSESSGAWVLRIGGDQ